MLPLIWAKLRYLNGIDRKGPHPAPHHSRPYHETSLCDTPLVVMVRAGVVWSGVGTLAVALGGELVRDSVLSDTLPITTKMCQGECSRPVGRDQSGP
jgi:hypothetical protein